MFRYSLLLTGSFLLPPKNHKTAQNFFQVYVFVCLIHLILFMAHFFASNWESKKTILLLVLLLNFNISPMFSFFLYLPRWNYSFRPAMVYKLYLCVLLLTSHRLSGTEEEWAKSERFTPHWEIKKKHNENEIIRKPLGDWKEKFKFDRMTK